MLNDRAISLLSKLIFACVFAGAATVSHADAECRDNPGTISVEGFSSVRAEPDVAFVRVAATVQSESAETARKAVENSVSRFVEGLAGIGMKTDNGDVRAESINVSPDYVYDSKTNERRISGYSAGRTVIVRVRKFEQISGVLDIAVSSGINNIHNISYELENPAPVMEEARLKAVADAAGKAKQITRALGVELGTIASVSYNTRTYGAFESSVQPRMLSKSVMSNGIADSAVYSPDKLEFTDNVSVVYNLEQTKKN